MSLDSPSSPVQPTDPGSRYLSASCLDFLLIELVPMAARIAQESASPRTDTDADGGQEKGGVLDEEEAREATFFRLEALGYRVGQGLAERFSRDRPRFTDHLDVIKFICKDLWVVLFRKQIDNLKTNHRVRLFGLFLCQSGT